ncbi:F-box protein At4g22280-like [Silene latifolia]|uniref:F-box protein At4g22280-like n=1 Tax=Silene latifolia TaxID=37657 RepID=UPI003D77624D
MKRISKKPKHGQLNPADRLSALPDNVVYHIVSFLGFKEACRTSILSKTWKYISDTNPDMELSNEVFSAKPGRADAYIKIDSFLKYVETRMKRYSKQKLLIKKLTLGFPIQRMTFRNTKVPLENKAEQWVEIAVRNQVEELVLIGPKNYELSHILFTSNSLRCLDCTCLEIYDYKGIAGFPSLESLFLDEVYVEDAVLNRIISSSLSLKHLRMVGCSGTYKSIKSIVIPCNSKLETLDLSKSLSIDEGIVTIESSSLTSFQYIGDSRSGGVTGARVERWPVISKDGVLRNLRVLKVGFVSITDEVLGKLLSELVLLETLKLCNCSMLKTIRISSALLKDFRVENCSDLLDVTIDAPCLDTFKYKGDFKLSMCINAVAGCDMSLHVPPSSFYPHRVSKLKRLLKGLSNRHVLKIALPEKPRKPNQNVCPVDIDFDDIDEIIPDEK